jgi:hypothetical protein
MRPSSARTTYADDVYLSDEHPSLAEAELWNDARERNFERNEMPPDLESLRHAAYHYYYRYDDRELPRNFSTAAQEIIKYLAIENVESAATKLAAAGCDNPDASNLAKSLTRFVSNVVHEIEEDVPSGDNSPQSDNEMKDQA